MAVLMGGSFTELLDLVDTQGYWDLKGGQPAPAALAKELTSDAADSPDALPGAKVRRLMLIRTAGEQKIKETVPALEALKSSQALFVADYASRALATINGTAHVPGTISDAVMESDLALLPENCGVVAQGRVIAADTKGPGLLEMIKESTGQEMPAEALKEFNTKLVAAAELVGNVRIDAYTMGLADDVGNDTGFVVIVGRGQYDSKAVAGLLALNAQKVEVDGVTFLQVEREFLIAFDSDDRVVVIGGPRQVAKPVGQVAPGLKNPRKPKFGAAMTALLAKIDRAKPLWVAAVIGDAYKRAKFLQPYETITLTGGQQGEKTLFKAVGTGPDPKALTESAMQIQSSIDMAAGKMDQAAEQMPAVKTFADLMKSIVVEAREKQVTATAELEGSISNAAALMPMMFFGLRSAQMRSSGPVSPGSSSHGHSVPAHPVPAP